MRHAGWHVLTAGQGAVPHRYGTRPVSSAPNTALPLRESPASEQTELWLTTAAAKAGGAKYPTLEAVEADILAALKVWGRIPQPQPRGHGLYRGRRANQPSTSRG